MGRVSRYKKTKSFDPFYKDKKHNVDTSKATKHNKKSLNDRKIIDEQKMPRAMKTLLERAQQVNSKKKKLKRLDTKQDKVTTFKKNKNENTQEYFQRIDREAAQTVVECLKGTQKMSDRRKNHLKKRKEKQKVKKNPERVLQTVEFTDLKDDVRFGDVASQPPTLTAKPRKAQEKEAKSLLLSQKLAEHKETNHNKEKPAVKTKHSKEKPVVKAKRRKHMTETEKAAMDKERLRVIEAYRKAKQKSSMGT